MNRDLILKFEKIKKNFDQIIALNDVSFEGLGDFCGYVLDKNKNNGEKIKVVIDLKGKPQVFELESMTE